MTDTTQAPNERADRSQEWQALRNKHLRAERPASSAGGVHHLALLSSNVERTIEFYQDVLEFPLTELFENRDYQGSTHFFFDMGNGNALAFFDFPGLDLGPYAEVLGSMHHLAISVTPEMGEVGEVVEDEHVRRVVNITKYRTAQGVIDGRLKVEMYGAGTSVTRFELFGKIDLLSTTTPIDDGHCTIRMDFFHGGDEASASIAEPFAKEVQRQFEQDVPIWENKRYLPSPALAPNEKPITEFRSWAAQFYV